VTQKFIAWQEESNKILRNASLPDIYDAPLEVNKFPVTLNKTQGLSDSSITRVALATSKFLDTTKWTLDFLRDSIDGKKFEANIQSKPKKPLKVPKRATKKPSIEFKAAPATVAVPMHLPQILKNLPQFVDEVVGTWKVQITRLAQIYI
jgi:hypothetical protein